MRNQMHSKTADIIEIIAMILIVATIVISIFK